MSGLNSTLWQQTRIRLTPKRQGFHLITDEVTHQVPGLSDIDIGLLHLFIQHSSAGLTLNENADPTVRTDMQRWFDETVREDTPYFEHTYEGPDDMPAHIKSSLVGASLSIPISAGRLAMGTWQGIYLCEFRRQTQERNLIATLQGQTRETD